MLIGRLFTAVIRVLAVTEVLTEVKAQSPEKFPRIHPFNWKKERQRSTLFVDSWVSRHILFHSIP